MEDRDKYGILLNGNIKWQRQAFREAVKLIGINVLYRAPLANKHYTTYAEIESNYAPPIRVGCLFHDHPTQQTLRKIGWISELQEGSSLIEVDYDLPNLQQGALFILPSGIDDAKGRLFRVCAIKNSMVYPVSVTCEIVPEYEDTLDPPASKDYSQLNFELMEEGADTQQFIPDDEESDGPEIVSIMED